jgi:pyridinium-3,5-biscarboxylic acid mononucleotide synthase
VSICGGYPGGVDVAGQPSVLDAGGGRRSDVLALLEAVRRGDAEPAAALERLGELPFRDLGFARVDTHRELRQGAPEAILAEGKSPGEIEAIARALLDDGAGSVLVTRADADGRAALRRVAADAEEDERARLAWVARAVPDAHGLVTIVSGGTSDGPVVTEARVRAELLGTRVAVHADAGVAGLHRLAAALEDLNRADCVVVVAGQDAALTSVVGGLVRAPVIGVPTSTGYGAAFGGLSALLSMLCSCAAGVAVVNIDDGFGAGTIAARIARASTGAP